MKKEFLLSIIIPCYNEAENITVLYQELKKYVNSYKHEIIFVNDGSSDDSIDIIKTLQQSDSSVNYISFTRNFGHQNALKAGYDFVNGDCIVSLDADMQHPPELIPDMVKLWEAGYKIVGTKRREIKSIGFFKRLTSRLFYKLINYFSEVKIESGTADFRLLDKQVVQELKKLNENFLFYRGLIPWIGFKQVYIEYSPQERYAGKTKYSMSKMIHFASSGITSFSVKPLKLSILLGFIIALVSFIYILYAIYISLLTNKAIPGWTSTIVSVLFIGSIQLIMIGILGNYLGKLFIENKNRPNYIIDEKSTNKD